REGAFRPPTDRLRGLDEPRPLCERLVADALRLDDRRVREDVVDRFGQDRKSGDEVCRTTADRLSERPTSVHDTLARREAPGVRCRGLALPPATLQFVD